ncbi:MAG: PTS fructose transporter subunit IIA [Desulfobacula sp.]|jgi:PTS system mannose-specific IIA component|uniref:PTS sugar transporter subunit IIA n=1 Tax=Desulfobacula sp. TaxID=2593537 RepID=UPI001E014859|nr:PTS fructose transporter subunit IIA [Desulfobacula sp.]MBT3485863.1 PTS fructose transporter subunit IIA [Desulfobacula sp.]MBT3805466.1 PTS fructose transporter subunit IIA [Desulfobacula sp.]MBT4026819.1 PTS fructose transporter subunit IIA [Desulfobacula sp.]MBT4199577.1 PTS fructose transporter subunit IIA [Desulfobacula sp.]
MTGILLVTHANLGSTLIETIEFILGKSQDNLSCVSINIQEDPATLRKKIKKGISKVKSDKGVIILTDMFGGTPSNLSYSFLKEGQVEVISGVNLPILLKAVTARSKMDMGKLTLSLVEHGKKSISLASEILKGTKRT